MFDLEQLEHAQTVVGAAMPATPAHAWPLLSERLGATAIVKHENHTPTGAFKVRGGLVYMDRLNRERPGTPGLISATTGNHGQSIAYAANRYRVPVTIYVPHGNSVEKNRAMRSFGANLVEHKNQAPVRGIEPGTLGLQERRIADAEILQRPKSDDVKVGALAEFPKAGSPLGEGAGAWRVGDQVAAAPLATGAEANNHIGRKGQDLGSLPPQQRLTDGGPLFGQLRTVEQGNCQQFAQRHRLGDDGQWDDRRLAGMEANGGIEIE